MAAGLSALRLIKKLKIRDYVAKMEELFLKELKAIQRKSNSIGDVRGKGMIFGVEYVKNKDTKEPAPELA